LGEENILLLAHSFWGRDAGKDYANRTTNLYSGLCPVGRTGRSFDCSEMDQVGRCHLPEAQSCREKRQ